jgi:uncharacterized protein (TIGR03032 family)
LRSIHTSSFPQLLEELGISLLVTTYQAGKLVVLRSDQGVLNTHFRSFSKPMGLAVQEGRLAIGTTLEIWEFHNVPAVARRVEPPGKHDACFLPRGSVTTGDIQIHEMAWGAPVAHAPSSPELWFVNTRFSCLCTRDGFHSFLPRWRPPFITELAPEDRCHLNGLGLRDGQPRYVTALGATNDPAGWRANKARGGVLMELPSGDILSRGLSMPHSPRWYADRLWVLESGAGEIGWLAPRTGKVERLAQLGGFTRGLDFCGPYAFIGLSQVRETAIFSGIPITERLQERTCGVWVVDIRISQTVAFVQFEEAVQEIFAVAVLPNMRFADLINDDSKLIADSFVVPDEALRSVPEGIRFPAR